MVAFSWELTKEIIELPLGCFQGGYLPVRVGRGEVAQRAVLDKRDPLVSKPKHEAITPERRRPRSLAGQGYTEQPTGVPRSALHVPARVGHGEVAQRLAPGPLHARAHLAIGCRV